MQSWASWRLASVRRIKKERASFCSGSFPGDWPAARGNSKGLGPSLLRTTPTRRLQQAGRTRHARRRQLLRLHDGARRDRDSARRWTQTPRDAADALRSPRHRPTQTSQTLASAERSFSKLKLLKNYLRSTMSQERLNGLATLCIEKRLLDKIDIDTIINDFASRNVRRNF